MKNLSEDEVLELEERLHGKGYRQDGAFVWVRNPTGDDPIRFRTFKSMERYCQGWITSAFREVRIWEREDAFDVRGIRSIRKYLVRAKLALKAARNQVDLAKWINRYGDRIFSDVFYQPF